jgi:hypothetical protein
MKLGAQFVLSLCAAAVVTAQVAASRDAAAALSYTNMSAAARCYGAPVSQVQGGSIIGKPTAGTTQALYCSVVDSTALQRDQVRVIAVDTYNLTGQAVAAEACLQDNVDGFVFTCSPQVQSTSSHHVVLNPNPSVWSGTGYPYVVVSLPGNGGTLMGISVTN